MDALPLRAFPSPDFEIPGLGIACRLCVEEGGVRGAAILDADGILRTHWGVFGERELSASREALRGRALSPGILARLREGEMLTISDAGSVYLGVAAKCLFIVIVDEPESLVLRRAAQVFRSDVDRMVKEARGEHVRTTPMTPHEPDGSSGSGSGPAELPVIELGITVPRQRPN